MSEATSTRKAVITTAQVQAAVDKYTETLSTISGETAVKMEFDKGARGKGFAVYNKAGDVVDTFETKEDAYVKFTNWVTVATQVLSLQQNRKPEEPAKTVRKTPTKPAESATA